ncbi:MAG TPA: ABC transporter permease [Dehalococcoidia bacterium]|nr:ABC transporter permease [Dehalococcoidia bacterium]
MTGLLRADFLKMRKRWMPYVLFVLMLVGAAFLIWAIGYSTWHDDDDPEWSASGFRTFAFPYSIPALLDSGQFWGSAIFVGILATSTLATEHNWGTVRPALAGGVSRARYLASKLLVLTLVSTVALLTALAFGVLLSLWATSVAGFDAPVPHPESFTAADLALMILRTALAIIPYGLIAFTFTVLSRSTALGIAGTMGYMVLEAIIVEVQGTGGGIFEHVRVLFIGHNVTALIAENQFDNLEYESMAFRDLGSSVPGVWSATFIIIAESALLLAASFFVFLHRDVTVSHG